MGVLFRPGRAVDEEERFFRVEDDFFVGLSDFGIIACEFQRLVKQILRDGRVRIHNVNSDK